MLSKNIHLTEEERRACLVASDGEVNAVGNESALSLGCKELVPIGNNEIGVSVGGVLQSAVETSST